MKCSKKIAETITTVFFISLLAGVGILFYLLPDVSYSETEKSMLQQAPAFSVSALLDGSYTNEVANYYADQFPARSLLIEIKALCELSLGKQENNSVMRGNNGYLIVRDDIPDTEALQNNLETLASFSDTLEIPFTFAVIGRSTDVMASALPPLANTARSDLLWDTFGENTAALNLQPIDLMTPLREAANAGESVWYRTDHHWTTQGAYLAYRILCDALELSPMSPDTFTVTCADNDFRGTTLAKSGFYWNQSDRIDYYRYAGDLDFVTSYPLTGISFAGFYDLQKLETDDPYASFLGGNRGRTDVVLPGIAREKLLLIKDSFAHAMVPFLAYHYDLVILDLRYYRGSVQSIIETEKIDRVLFLQYITSLTENAGLGLLNS